MLQVKKSLRELRKNLKKMTEVVSGMMATIDKSIQKENWRRVEKVFREDKKLDSLETTTDKLAIEVLALLNPRAGDLRFVFSAIKLSVDLERIGDECKNVAREFSDFSGKVPKDLKELSKKVHQMLNDCFKSLFDNDAKAAKKVILADDAVDRLEYKIITKRKDSKNSIHLAFIAKSLERIADHATNIAEKVVYNVEGTDIRHENTLSRRQQKK